MTYGQVDKLKTAIAASELIPLLVYSPYLLVMLRKCATANTQQRFVQTVGYGVLGFCLFDPVSV